MIFNHIKHLHAEGKAFSGHVECYQRGIEIVFNDRDHSFSSSSLRRRVVKQKLFGH